MTKRTGRRPGRPKRKEASRKALATVDLSAVDPVAVLKSIAADESVPASARVQAARALIANEKRAEQPENHGGDAVSRAALVILQGGKR